MKTKPYNQEKDQKNKVSEPMVTYTKAEQVSISGWNMSADTFNELIKRAESNFATGQFITSTDLLRKIKEQRGWL